VAAALHRHKPREQGQGLSPAVLEAMPLPVAVVDRAGALIAFNRPFLNACGFEHAQCAPGMRLAELAAGHSGVETLAAMARALADDAKPDSAVNRTDLADGTIVLTCNAPHPADHAGRSKAAFLASMSHELRTPLNAVIGFADIIKEQLFGPISSDKYIEYADEIRRSGHGLLSIINNIIDLSRIEAGQFKLREEEADLAELIQGCVRRLADIAAAGKVAIEQDCPEGFPLVSIDPRALQQVLGNILSNAIKFTPQGGSVKVGFTRVEGGVELAVADTGVGISAEQLARMGEAFLQSDDVLIRSHQGAGLGLALSKSLVSLLDGRLKIASVEGRGTRVAIFLPASRVVEPA
jgi:signal transduction histidine kinase